MEIFSRQPTLSLQVLLASAPALVRAWQVGQVIEAMVVRVVPERKAVLLQLAEGEVEAQTELPLRPGMRLQLTAEPRGNQWQLRVADEVTATHETLTAALRQALPRAAPLAPVFETIERLLQHPPKDLPERIRLAAKTLAQARPTPERLSKPEGLHAALRDSGVLLESRLATPAAPPPASDLKAQLLTLLLALTSTPPSDTKAVRPTFAPPDPTAAAGSPKPAADGPARDPSPARGTPGDEPGSDRSIADRPATHPPAPARADRDPSIPGNDPEFFRELLRQVEGALSRIQLHQLRALPDTQHEPQWIFELPVQTSQGTESLLLRFDREAERETRSGRSSVSWRVTLDLTHPEHGALRAILSWRGGEITTHFFAARSATAELFRRHLPALTKRLTGAGIAVGAVEAHVGIPTAPTHDAASGILSERA